MRIQWDKIWPLPGTQWAPKKRWWLPSSLCILLLSVINSWLRMASKIDGGKSEMTKNTQKVILWKNKSTINDLIFTQTSYFVFFCVFDHVILCDVFSPFELSLAGKLFLIGWDSYKLWSPVFGHNCGLHSNHAALPLHANSLLLEEKGEWPGNKSEFLKYWFQKTQANLFCHLCSILCSLLVLY